MPIKSLAGVLITGVAALLAVPLLFSGRDAGESAAAPGACGAPSAVAGGIDGIAATIRVRESGGDYRSRRRGSTASGAYQFTDATWAGYGGYASSWQAPPEVQDAKAAQHITGILTAHDGDVAAIPVVWYLGYVPPPEDAAWDRVPDPDAGNQLTPRQYQAAWLEDYGALAAASGDGERPPTCRVEVPAGMPVELTTVEGITVHQQIASQVAGLVQAARADGFTLTGGGYRSPQRQIELRRQNCGSSQYAIYEMPSSQCSPPTARPGSSNHEMGLAIDFTCNGSLIRSRSSACFAWLSANAARFGLHNLPSEPWHWSVDGT